MSNVKAIIDFSTYTAAELGPVAQTIHNQLAANAGTFAELPVPIATLQTQVGNYDGALVARASNAKADVIAFNEARVVLEGSLGVLGNYVNGVAQGEPMTVNQSGFPSYDTAHAPNYAPPAAPENVRIAHGELSGTLVVRYKPDRHNSTNEVQCCTGDPNNAADWTLKGIFKGGRAEIAGCLPGAVVWMRVRTVGLRGVMGAWSAAAQIRVL